MHTDRILANISPMDLLAQESALSPDRSRSAGLLSGAGNADAEVKTRLSDKAADDFRVLARSFGMGTAEFLRIIVLTRLYGVEGVAMMTNKHLEQVAGVGPEKAPK